MNLSILIVTAGGDHAWPFINAAHFAARQIGSCELVVCVDGQEAFSRLQMNRTRAAFVKHTVPFTLRVLPKSPGFIEANLDRAIGHCIGEYILRIDDDETISPAMLEWLRREEYRSHEIWRFPRVTFWRDVCSVLITPALWPDWQTRLSTRGKAGGRRPEPHTLSPFGEGEPARVCLEHHKFLVKDVAERRRIAETYDRAKAGLGTGSTFKVYSLPEEVYQGSQVVLVEYPSSQGFSDWQPKWREACTL